MPRYKLRKNIGTEIDNALYSVSKEGFNMRERTDEKNRLFQMMNKMKMTKVETRVTKQRRPRFLEKISFEMKFLNQKLIQSNVPKTVAKLFDVYRKSKHS